MARLDRAHGRARTPTDGRVSARGHRRVGRRRSRRRGARRPAAGRDRVDEDGARRRGRRRRRGRPASPSRSATTVHAGRRRSLLDRAADVGARRRRRRRGRRSTSTAMRADLAEVVARHDVGLDAARPDAVARRRATGQRTARENVDDLVDDGSFVEYGPLVIAAQRRRRARRGPDRAHAGRRPGRRHRHASTAQLATGRSMSLRLHGARRHAGPAEPPQEGPAVRAGRAAAAAGRVLHRGRRRAARATPTAPASPGLDCHGVQPTSAG